jgi:hypothetical protein
MLCLHFHHQVQVILDVLLSFDNLRLPDEISKKVLTRKSGLFGLTFEVKIKF